MSRTREVQAAARRGRQAWLPPRWFVVLFWHGHRALLRATRGRLGLWRPKPGRWGALRLTTTGRRTGRPRQVVVGYFEDGGNLVSMAMNGWGAAEPAWWLNLQADPHAFVELAGGLRRAVVARPAVGSERERLWERWRELDRNLDSYAARRPGETAVVVFEPARFPGHESRRSAMRAGSAQPLLRRTARERDRRRLGGAGRVGEPERHGVSGVMREELCPEVVAGRDRRAVDARDHVAGPQSRLLGGCSGHDVGDDQPG